MTYSLGAISDLGEISSENAKKEAQLTIFPLPLSDSDETDIFDFGGAIRKITLAGIKEDTQANLTTFLNDLFGLISGDQNAQTVYTSDLLGTINVKIMDVDGTYFAGEPRRVEYNITLIEASDRG